MISILADFYLKIVSDVDLFSVSWFCLFFWFFFFSPQNSIFFMMLRIDVACVLKWFGMKCALNTYSRLLCGSSCSLMIILLSDFPSILTRHKRE